LTTKAKLDKKKRISLPADTIKRLAGQLTEDEIAWMFVVDPGHLHVFSQEELGKRVDLKALADADVLTMETREARRRVGGLRLRLTRAAIDQKRNRLTIPDEAFEKCEEYHDRSSVWLSQTSVSLDIYTATYQRRELGRPASHVLPEPVQDDEE
jgi:DNA-binding transcriptional regulator/RsmH inhibitor MraZ